MSNADKTHQETPPIINDQVIKAFQNALPSDCWTCDPEIIAPHLTEWRQKYQGQSPMMITPKTTEQVQTVVKLAAKHHCALCIQGGNTGLVGGSTPGLEGRREILLSLKHLNKIAAPCPTSRTITCGAGAILEHIQRRATEYGFYFPLSLASEGSCSIGGNLSTNAGGIHVLKYGTTRALVAGIEAVLPNGQIFSNLAGLMKDNTGYDLQNLLIGAEGTLGIITRVKLKLFPQDKTRLTAFVCTDSAQSAIQLLSELQADFSNQVAAYELIGKTGLEFVFRHMKLDCPVERLSDWAVVFDITSSEERSDWPEKLENILMDKLKDGQIADVVIPQNSRQQDHLWTIRESMSEAQKHEGGSIKHDISLPLNQIVEFLTKAPALCQTIVPDCRPTPFGHLGDGNLHYNIMQPCNMDKDDFLNHWTAMSTAIHDLVCDMGGSISAEHGIGTLKRDELAHRYPIKAAHFQAIKKALDPDNLLNGGRLIALK